MKHLGNNVYVPDDGYKYIVKGDMFCTQIRLGTADSINNWHDTNEEPPEPADEPTAEDKAEAYDILMGVES